MDKVKVNRTELLAKLRENRDNHKTEYKDALAGWEAKVLEVFDTTLGALQQGDFSVTNPAVSLPKPQHHLKDYDLAIRMLEMSIDDNIEIDMHDFNQYVMDEWSWKAGFAMTNSSYLS